MDIVTIVGYVAMVLLAVSLLMTSLIKLRMINLFGCVCFTIYGLLLVPTAWPVAIINAMLTLVNAYFIITAFMRRGHNFEMIRCERNDVLFGKFVSYHEKDVKKFMPKFDWKKVPENALCFMLLRNMELAGVWIASVRDLYTYELNVDYVADKYRDLKSGKHVYFDNRELLRSLGVKYLVSDRHSDAHSAYLEKIGFDYRDKDRLYKFKL